MRAILVSVIFFCLFGIPSRTILAAPLLQEMSGFEYIVQPGNSLSQIARDELGDAKLWSQIVEATNARAAADTSFVEVQNPRLIRPGQKLWIPAQTPAPKAFLEREQPQDDPLADLLAPSADGIGFYGYIDIDGDFVIAPRFVIAGEFREGLAVVSEDGINFGYIDRSGEMVIPAVYKDAGYFSEGLAPVRIFEKVDFSASLYWSTYINRNGESEFLEFYLYTEPFVDGIAKAVDEEFQTVYLVPSGRQVSPPVKQSDPVGVTNRYIDEALATLPPSREGTCENYSRAADHWRIWQCTVDDQMYDPCLLAADATSVVCQYPLDPFTVVDPNTAPDDDADSDTGIDVQIGYEGPPTPLIERFYLALRGDDAKRCVRVFEDLWIGDDLASYLCDDGAYLVGAPRALKDGRWIATKVQVVGAETELSVISQKAVIIGSFSTLVEGSPESESQADIIPPYMQRTYYWRYR